MDVTIRRAYASDAAVIAGHDKWIKPDALDEKIAKGEVFAAYDGEKFVGWLRWNLFWDNTPFMTMLHLLPEYHRMGIGKRMVMVWESEMKKSGYEVLMTSTAQTEFAQHFYVALGYKAIGGFTLENEPMEIMFSKRV